MSSFHGPPTVILGHDEGRQALDRGRLEELLAPLDLEHEIQVAARPGDARGLAREAVREGARYLVWVGDDRTLHDMVNGFMDGDPPAGPELVVAGIPGDSGSDFLRTMGLNDRPEHAVRRLATEPWFAIDVVRVAWGPGTDPSSSFFVNVAQAGLAGDQARRRARLPAALGRLGDLLAFWGTLARYHVPEGVVRLDRRSYGGPLANLVVANGQFVRRGVRLAQKAHPGDGKLDVMIYKSGKRDWVQSIPASLRGEHTPSPKIKEMLSARVEVTSEGALPIELDGRPAGHAPAVFEVVPQAFRLKI